MSEVILYLNPFNAHTTKSPPPPHPHPIPSLPTPPSREHPLAGLHQASKCWHLDAVPFLPLHVAANMPPVFVHRLHVRYFRGALSTPRLAVVGGGENGSPAPMARLATTAAGALFLDGSTCVFGIGRY